MEQAEVVGTQEQGTSSQAHSDTSSRHTSSPEKTFTQSDLDKIAGRIRDETRHEYYERGKREAAEMHQAQQSSSSSSSSSLGGMEQVSPEKLGEMVEDKVREMANAEYGKQAVYEFATKMSKGKEKYPDFDDVVSQLNLPANPQLVTLVKDLENADEVMYELAKDPAKAAHVLMIGNSFPHLAPVEMQKLSASIKAKKQGAETQPSANEPLSQLKRSTAGSDTGERSIKDLRKQPWLKA